MFGDSCTPVGFSSNPPAKAFSLETIVKNWIDLFVRKPYVVDTVFMCIRICIDMYVCIYIHIYIYIYMYICKDIISQFA